MTSRRRFIQIGTLGAIAPTCVFAQARPVKVGMLAPRPLNESFYAPGMLRRLAELGYLDGAGMVLEYRSSDGFADRYPKLARELIALKCDVIFAIGAELPVRALQAARAPMPVVFLAIEYDPLDKGIVKSLARPEGNMTGLYLPQNEMGAKRLEIMHEVIPAARRFLVFADATSKGQLVAIRKAAMAAGVQLTVVEFSVLPYDFAGAFEMGKKAKVEAFVGLSSGVFAASENPIASLLLKYRLPGIGSTLRMNDAGYLLGFNADVIKVTRRVAEIGARILKGARPADIPVEQADEFELTVNAKTARALGIKVAESVLARATKIVQ